MTRPQRSTNDESATGSAAGTGMSLRYPKPGAVAPQNLRTREMLEQEKRAAERLEFLRRNMALKVQNRPHWAAARNSQLRQLNTLLRDPVIMNAFSSVLRAQGVLSIAELKPTTALRVAQAVRNTLHQVAQQMQQPQMNSMDPNSIYHPQNPCNPNNLMNNPNGNLLYMMSLNMAAEIEQEKVMENDAGVKKENAKENEENAAENEKQEQTQAVDAETATAHLTKAVDTLQTKGEHHFLETFGTMLKEAAKTEIGHIAMSLGRH